MKPIPFTQYLLPDGRKKSITIERPDDIADMAEKIIETGEGQFTSEVLQTGDVSFAFETDEEDLVLDVCPNGPEVLDSVDFVVKETFKLLGLNNGL
jgi:hypothetical protein